MVYVGMVTSFLKNAIRAIYFMKIPVVTSGVTDNCNFMPICMTVIGESF